MKKQSIRNILPMVKSVETLLLLCLHVNVVTREGCMVQWNLSSKNIQHIYQVVQKKTLSLHGCLLFILGSDIIQIMNIRFRIFINIHSFSSVTVDGGRGKNALSSSSPMSEIGLNGGAELLSLSSSQ